MISQDPDRPYLVGCYTDAAGEQFLPVSQLEVDRAVWLYRRILDTSKLPKRSCAVLISRYRDAAFTLPLERAMVADGYIPCHTEATTFDAPRVETFLRRLDAPAVFGVTSAVLDGLEGAHHDIGKLFAGRLIWARGEDAYQRLATLDGFTLLRWMEVGPAPGVECSPGSGLHVDDSEWLMEQGQGGEILLSSRLPRAQAFARLATGVRGTLDHTPCRCGLSGPRLTPS